MGPHGAAWGRMGPHGVSMGPHGVSMGPHGVGMGMGLAWGWHGVGMGLAWDWHGVGMGLAWGWHGVRSPDWGRCEPPNWGALWASIGPLIGAISLPIDYA
jgi:hypothetical protein